VAGAKPNLSSACPRAWALPGHVSLRSTFPRPPREADREPISGLFLRDFPSEVVVRYGIEVLHPDEFLSLQLDLAPEVVCAAGKTQRMALKNPPLSPEEFVRSLEKQGLPKTVASLERYVDLL
jgi:hypothetical protein